MSCDRSLVDEPVSCDRSVGAGVVCGELLLFLVLLVGRSIDFIFSFRFERKFPLLVVNEVVFASSSLFIFSICPWKFGIVIFPVLLSYSISMYLFSDLFLTGFLLASSGLLPARVLFSNFGWCRSSGLLLLASSGWCSSSGLLLAWFLLSYPGWCRSSGFLLLSKSGWCSFSGLFLVWILSSNSGWCSSLDLLKLANPGWCNSSGLLLARTLFSNSGWCRSSGLMV